jgi:hypothetical protein
MTEFATALNKMNRSEMAALQAPPQLDAFFKHLNKRLDAIDARLDRLESAVGRPLGTFPAAPAADTDPAA